LTSTDALDKVTPLAAFFYLALFRVTRRWAQDFVASNPTWIRVPKSNAEKKRPTKQVISKLFVQEVELLSKHCDRFSVFREADANRLQLMLSNAENLSLRNNSVDAIITSPPYCTRIDYAVATYIELAILRIGGKKFSTLRRSLTGSLTVEKNAIDVNPQWGGDCRRFLRALHDHPSKASKTYYYKSHLQYFNSLYKSLTEASRVLVPNGPCIFVVQNSYYKEIRNDIASIVSEMAENLSMSLIKRADFSAPRSMVEVNQRSKKYVGNRSTIESVLCFKKGQPQLAQPPTLSR
jgi:hypothetical protein